MFIVLFIGILKALVEDIAKVKESAGKVNGSACNS
jgi:hypothetical protein